MKKLFAVMLIPFFLTSLSAVSTEKSVDLTNVEKYQLAAGIATTAAYYDSLPSNPILIQATDVFKDSNLTTVSGSLAANQHLDVIDLSVNDNSEPVFKLSNGSYIKASHQLIYDDVVLSQESDNEKYWLKEDFKVYQAPYVVGT